MSEAEEEDDLLSKLIPLMTQAERDAFERYLKRQSTPTEIAYINGEFFKRMDELCKEHNLTG